MYVQPVESLKVKLKVRAVSVSPKKIALKWNGIPSLHLRVLALL